MSEERKIIPFRKRGQIEPILTDAQRWALCEARKAADAHSHREVLALYKACIDVARVRISFNAALHGTSADGGAVTALAFRRCAAVLHKHRVIHVAAEHALNCLRVGLVAICGDLDAIAKARTRIRDKLHRGFCATVTNAPRCDKLCVGINRNPSPCVARTIRRSLRTRDVLLFRVNERPNLIEL